MLVPVDVAHAWILERKYVGFFGWKQFAGSGAERVLAVVLTPGTLRSSDQAQVLTLREGVEQVRIDFQSPGAATAAIALVDNGVVLWSGAVQGGVATVPSSRFREGDLVATLKNAEGEDLADYSFRVVRAP